MEQLKPRVAESWDLSLISSNESINPLTDSQLENIPVSGSIDLLEDSYVKIAETPKKKEKEKEESTEKEKSTIEEEEEEEEKSIKENFSGLIDLVEKHSKLDSMISNKSFITPKKNSKKEKSILFDPFEYVPENKLFKQRVTKNVPLSPSITRGYQINQPKVRSNLNFEQYKNKIRKGGKVLKKVGEKKIVKNEKKERYKPVNLYSHKIPESKDNINENLGDDSNQKKEENMIEPKIFEKKRIRVEKRKGFKRRESNLDDSLMDSYPSTNAPKPIPLFGKGKKKTTKRFSPKIQVNQKKTKKSSTLKRKNKKISKVSTVSNSKDFGKETKRRENVSKRTSSKNTTIKKKSNNKKKVLAKRVRNKKNSSSSDNSFGNFFRAEREHDTLVDAKYRKILSQLEEKIELNNKQFKTLIEVISQKRDRKFEDQFNGMINKFIDNFQLIQRVIQKNMNNAAEFESEMTKKQFSRLKKRVKEMEELARVSMLEKTKTIPSVTKFPPLFKDNEIEPPNWTEQSTEDNSDIKLDELYNEDVQKYNKIIGEFNYSCIKEKIREAKMKNKYTPMSSMCSSYGFDLFLVPEYDFPENVGKIEIEKFQRNKKTSKYENIEYLLKHSYKVVIDQRKEEREREEREKEEKKKEEERLRIEKEKEERERERKKIEEKLQREKEEEERNMREKEREIKRRREEEKEKALEEKRREEEEMKKREEEILKKKRIQEKFLKDKIEKDKQQNQKQIKQEIEIEIIKNSFEENKKQPNDLSYQKKIIEKYQSDDNNNNNENGVKNKNGDEEKEKDEYDIKNDDPRGVFFYNENHKPFVKQKEDFEEEEEDNGFDSLPEENFAFPRNSAIEVESQLEEISESLIRETLSKLSNEVFNMYIEKLLSSSNSKNNPNLNLEKIKRFPSLRAKLFCPEFIQFCISSQVDFAGDTIKDVIYELIEEYLKETLNKGKKDEVEGEEYDGVKIIELEDDELEDNQKKLENEKKKNLMMLSALLLAHQKEEDEKKNEEIIRNNVESGEDEDSKENKKDENENENEDKGFKLEFKGDEKFFWLSDETTAPIIENTTEKEDEEEKNFRIVRTEETQTDLENVDIHPVSIPTPQQEKKDVEEEEESKNIETKEIDVQTSLKKMIDYEVQVEIKPKVSTTEMQTSMEKLITTEVQTPVIESEVKETQTHEEEFEKEEEKIMMSGDGESILIKGNDIMMKSSLHEELKKELDNTMDLENDDDDDDVILSDDSAVDRLTNNLESKTILIGQKSNERYSTEKETLKLRVYSDDDDDNDNESEDISKWSDKSSGILIKGDFTKSSIHNKLMDELSRSLGLSSDEEVDKGLFSENSMENFSSYQAMRKNSASKEVGETILFKGDFLRSTLHEKLKDELTNSFRLSSENEEDSGEDISIDASIDSVE